MKSLLHKTLSQFLVCTVAIFILATPLFFLLTKYFYAEDMIDIIEAVHIACGCRLMIRCRRQNSSTWRKVQCLSFRKPK